MSTSTVNEIIKSIRLGHLNREELMKVNDIVRDSFSKLNTKMAMEFCEGDRVEWTGKRGHVTGTVMASRATKTIKVRADNGIIWTCSPSLISHME